jgi:hypothetical protein
MNSCTAEAVSLKRSRVELRTWLFTQIASGIGNEHIP